MKRKDSRTFERARDIKEEQEEKVTKQPKNSIVYIIQYYIYSKFKKRHTHARTHTKDRLESDFRTDCHCTTNIEIWNGKSSDSFSLQPVFSVCKATHTKIFTINLLHFVFVQFQINNIESVYLHKNKTVYGNKIRTNEAAALYIATIKWHFCEPKE